MSTTSRVAAAVAAGYVLGRFKKLRMAVMVGSAMANENVRHSVWGVVRQGSGRFRSSSVGGTLTQEVGSKLVDAGKSAAMATAASRVDALSDRLAARSESLRGTEREAGPDAAEEPEDEYEEEPAEEEPAEAEEEEPEEPAPRATRSARRQRSASPGRRSGG